MVRLDIAAVWRMTVDIVRRHFSTFVTLTAAFVFLPAVFLAVAFPEAGVFRLPVPGQAPPPFPAGLILLGLLSGLVGLVGHFSIGAIAADPAEGGGRSLGQIIAAVLPKIGKGLIAGLYLLLAYLALCFVAVVIVTILAAMFGAVGGMRTSVPPGGVLPAPTASAMMVGGLLLVIVLPLMIWATARLSPMLGVLLREPLSAFDSIKRAWALSRGSALPIAGMLLLVGVASLLVGLVVQGIGSALGLNAGVALLLVVVARSAVSALIAVYYYTATAVIYRQLVERR